MHKCDYGCNRKAKHQFKNKKWCCDKSTSSCPGVRKKIDDKLRTDFKEIVTIVEANKYKVISSKEEYKNQFSYLLLKCTEGHEYFVWWDSFKSGSRCPKCSAIKRGKNNRVQFEDIKYIAKIEKFKLLTTKEEYENKFQKKLKFRCQIGHEFEMRLDHFKSRRRCPKCSKKEATKKIRIKFIKRMESRHGQMSPAYNPEACKLIDEYGKENNYSFQHAENGGEFHVKGLGYFVDGYDKERNTVIEIDERHHFDRYGNLNERDVQRQKEIISFLKCNFIRLKISGEMNYE
mgnify:CR=1 FL=1